MTIFHKIVRGSSDFLRSLKSENKKQLTELEKLEKKIEDLQGREKNNVNNVVLDNRAFLKFRIV